MKLKRYIQFIKESIKEQIEEGTLWKLTEDDITDYMLEITDAGYYVSVEFGFSEKAKQYSYKDGKRVETEKDIFNDKVKAGDKVVLLVNNLGGTSNLEMGICVQDLYSALEAVVGEGNVARTMVGTFMSAFDMHGISATILVLLLR